MNRLNVISNGFLLIIFTLLLANNVDAQKQDKMLKVYLGNKQFYDPTIGNYIEFQLHFEGHTLNYVPTNEGLLGEVVVIMEVKAFDSIVRSDAYRLKSPIMKDSIFDDFYDVKRFALNPGDYTLSIELKDFNSENESIKATKKIHVNDFSKGIQVSDVQVSEMILGQFVENFRQTALTLPAPAGSAAGQSGAAEPTGTTTGAASTTASDAPKIAKEINGLAIFWQLIKGWWQGLFGSRG